MKNENESKEKIQRSSSSTSEALGSIDLTQRATTSIEPHLVNLKPSESDNASQTTTSEVATAAKSPNKLLVVKEVLNNLLDATIHDVPTTSRQQFLESSYDERLERHTASSQPDLIKIPKTDIRICRSAGAGIINSTSAMHSENYVRLAASKISLKRVPPSYSTVLKQGAPSAPLSYFDESRTFSSIPFIARQPPPSYAEVHGWDASPSIVSSDSVMLGPNPIYISCPRCRTVVISDIHSERSNLAYIVSLVMCVFVCWPCCLVPFCIKSCRNTYHFCPTCNYYLGVYRPC